MTCEMNKPTFENLDPEAFDKFIELATNHLIDAVQIPLSDDAWTSDRYTDMIYNKAKELYEESNNDISR